MDTERAMEWRETVSGQYERELDAAEMFYASMAKTWEATGHTYFAITASVDFTINILKYTNHEEFLSGVLGAFRTAWKRLRYQFPTLAAQVIYDPVTKKCKKVYTSPTKEQDVESWMQETFFVVKDQISGKEFANSDQPVGRFATLHVLTTAVHSGHGGLEGTTKRMNVLFRCRHDIIDGIGTLKLLNYLFNFAAAAFGSPSSEAAIVFGSEQETLSPPLQIAAQIPTNPTEQQISNFNAIRAANNRARENVEVIGFPGRIEKSKPERSQRTAIKLSGPETSKVIQRCKAFGVTATHLFHTAIAIALGDIQDRSEQERKARYITYALMNLRGICGNPGDIDLHPASVLQTVSVKHLIVDLNIPAKSDITRKPSKEELLGTLLRVKDFYVNNIINADFIATIPTLYKAVTPPYPEVTPKVPEPSSFRAISLSSLGVVDKLILRQHGPFTITDPWAIGAEYSTGLGLFLGTFNGEMSLGAGYNEAFHLEPTVLAYLEKVKSVAMDIVDAMGA